MMRRLLYPVMVLLPACLGWAIYHATGRLALATFAGSLTLVISTTILEAVLPFRRDWQMRATPGDWRNAQLNLVYYASSFSMQELLKAAGYAVIVPAIVWLSLHASPHVLWLAGQPLLLQVFVLFLISDFVLYWCHRAMHTFPRAWALHQIHHSVPQLNWTAAARLHPLEHLVNSGPRYAVMLACAASPDAVLVFLLLYNAFGFTHHCNVDIDTEWLDKIIYTPIYHRFHHSQRIVESNSNYGGPLLIWDWLFGTLYRPHSRGPEALGLLAGHDVADPSEVSHGVWRVYLRHLGTPFRAWRKG